MKIKEPPSTKLVVVINGKLGMSGGKLASQACHAVTHLLRGKHPDWVKHNIDLWDQGNGRTIIVLKAEDEKQMAEIAYKAWKHKLHVGPVVIDEGRTEIPPRSLTAQAFGPDIEEAFDGITSELKLA